MDDTKTSYLEFGRIVIRKIKVIYPNIERDICIQMIFKLWIVCEKNLEKCNRITDTVIKQLHEYIVKEINIEINTEINTEIKNKELEENELEDKKQMQKLSDNGINIDIKDYSEIHKDKLSLIKTHIKQNKTKKEDNYNYSKDMKLKDEICKFITKIKNNEFEYEYIWTVYDLMYKYIKNNNINDDVIEYYSNFISEVDKDDITYYYDIETFTNNIFSYGHNDNIKEMLFEIFDV